MKKRIAILMLVTCFVVQSAEAQSQPTAPAAAVTAVKAGRLIDPETGTAATNQVILIRGEKIEAVGANVAIPAGS